MTIVPSIIAQDQRTFDKIYSKIKIAQTIHLDVMDGEYVPNKSLWFPFQLPTHDYEAHLMTTKPELFIGKHHDKIKTFIVHVETTQNVDALIEFVHSMRCRVFLALKPSIPVARIRRYIKKVDGVLVMTVQPGKYGAPFLRNQVGKIRQLRNMNRNLTIEVDGSVNDKTIRLLKEAGANRFSVGSYIQRAKDVKEAINELLNA
jgi:ribulose-phosphate 3-epimerase